MGRQDRLRKNGSIFCLLHKPHVAHSLSLANSTRLMKLTKLSMKPWWVEGITKEEEPSKGLKKKKIRDVTHTLLRGVRVVRKVCLFFPFI